MELVDRFWSKVNKTDTCWLWAAHISLKGYGQFNVNGKILAAHRVAWNFVIGPIPEGLQLDHLCRVRHCVNPDHLEPVTAGINQERGLRGVLRPQLLHCIDGHELTKENTYITPKGCHQCRICRRIARRKSDTKRRTKQKGAD